MDFGERDVVGHGAHERVGGNAAARQTVLARSAIAPYTRRVVDPPRLEFLSRRAGAACAGSSPLVLEVLCRRLKASQRLLRPEACSG